MGGVQLIPNRELILKVAREVVSQIVGHPVEDSQRLVSSGMIDSLSILKLIAQLEKQLNTSIPTATLQPEDFDDISLIVGTIERVAAT